MRKKASELKKGEKIKILGKVLTVANIEVSEIGKQGSSKCRIEFTNELGEKTVMIRPAEYPFEVV